MATLNPEATPEIPENSEPTRLSPFFNAHHSPTGAFGSFTFGCKGPLGGLGIELKGPADENVFIGVEDINEPGKYKALPFSDSLGHQLSAEDYDVEGLSDFQFPKAVTMFEDADIYRTLGACVDEWTAGDLTFRIASPLHQMPDPETGDPQHLKETFAPTVYAELTIDNRSGTKPRKAFFGYGGSNRNHAMRTWQANGITGIGQGRDIAIATNCPTAYAGAAWQPEAILNPRHQENVNFILGSIALLVCLVPAGEVKTFQFSIAFFRDGFATSGVESRYLYRRWFNQIEEVVKFGLDNCSQAFEKARLIDNKIASKLTPTRAWMVSQAIRSYLGATQALELADGRPLWVVNEGEYRMMNTFDLTVDQLYMELALNPWAVRNVLDFFVERYSYEDNAKFPGENETHPAGIAFCHDMGVGNVFTPEGFSCYEQAGLHGVFSYMSYEELVNWAVCACLYHAHTKDEKWIVKQKQTFVKVVESMANRDNPNPEERNGVMGLDSARCKEGKEITTYDSLDVSLGQARNNLYLAVKSWGAYALLEPVLSSLGETTAATLAATQAEKCAATVVASADQEGYMPAVIGEGVESRIIPAIEGLIFPFVAGRPDLITGKFKTLTEALNRHLDLVLNKQTCLFEDNGWKLSSTSRNSWLSKVYLCQFISESILGNSPDYAADEAHMSWLRDGENAYFAWSDQMVSGKAQGSRYYPRGVTSLLWLAEGNHDPLRQIQFSMFE
jgi:hypothetical protein